MRETARERTTALLLFVILAFYSGTIGWRGALLVADGRLVPVLLGVAVIVLPLVTLVAIWRLVVFARDGSAMMRHLGSGATVEDRDETWRAHLVQAEEHRMHRERSAEQAAYRQAVRAWRVTRPSRPSRSSPPSRP